MKFRVIRNAIFLAIFMGILGIAVYNFFGIGSEDIPVTLPKPTAATDIFIGDELGMGKYTIADISPETVCAIIETLSRADEYSRNITVTNYWNGGENTANLSCFVSEKNAHVIRDDGYSVRHEMILDGSLYVWYDGVSGTFSASDVESVSPYYIDQMAHLQTYEELLHSTDIEILDAGYETAFDEGCIFAEYVSGEFGYRTRIYVSIASGLLMGASRYDGDTLIYEMQSSAPSFSALDSSHFTLP